MRMGLNVLVVLCCALVAGAGGVALPIPTQDTLVVAKSEEPTVTATPDGEVLSTEEPLQPIKLLEMDVRSEVSLRYAQTAVVTKIRNPAARAQETFFRVLLPETAYISGFVMTLNGTAYKAYVKGKEEAKQIYVTAVSQGVGAAHIATKARDSNHFTVSVNVEPRTEAIFNLTYEELLVRRNGVYNQAINLHPGGLVPKLKVTVHLKESQKITDLRVPEVRSGNEVDATAEDKQNPLATIERGHDDREATITFTPDLKEQERLIDVYTQKAKESASAARRPWQMYAEEGEGEERAEGVLGQFVVQYDVARPEDGEIIVNDGYFVHFFAPASPAPLSKHVVFVLDTSGSMMERKIEQLREALTYILGDLNPGDYFNIVEFSSSATVHDLKEAEQDIKPQPQPFDAIDKEVTLVPPSPATPENIARARVIVSRLIASGGTNIATALDVAITLVNKGIDWTPKANLTSKVNEQKAADSSEDKPGDSTTTAPKGTQSLKVPEANLTSKVNEQKAADSSEDKPGDSTTAAPEGTQSLNVPKANLTSKVNEQNAADSSEDKPGDSTTAAPKGTQSLNVPKANLTSKVNEQKAADTSEDKPGDSTTAAPKGTQSLKVPKANLTSKVNEQKAADSSEDKPGDSTTIATKVERIVEPIIIFLTDGDPTVGETDPKRILTRLAEKNSGSHRATVFSLAFGEDADRHFLRKVSLRNAGFMRHIYEGADAVLQLRDFYRQVASPLLANVHFVYPPEQVMEGSVTQSKFRLQYGGAERVVAGRVSPDAVLTPTVEAFCGLDDKYTRSKYRVTPKLASTTATGWLPLERLWAYLTVQQLLDQRDAAVDKYTGPDTLSPEKKALKLALKYEFVTPLTSLVVVKPNATKAVDAESVDGKNEEDTGLPRPPIYAMAGPAVPLQYQQSIAPAQAQYGSYLSSHSPLFDTAASAADVQLEEDYDIIKEESVTVLDGVDPSATPPLPSPPAPLALYRLQQLPWTEPLIDAAADLLRMDVNGTTVEMKLTRDYDVQLTSSISDPSCTNAVPTTSPAGGDAGAAFCVYLPRCAAATSIDVTIYKNTYCKLVDGRAGVCCPESEVIPKRVITETSPAPIAASTTPAAR